jgi:hypothetical protein
VLDELQAKGFINEQRGGVSAASPGGAGRWADSPGAAGKGLDPQMVARAVEAPIHRVAARTRSLAQEVRRTACGRKGADKQARFWPLAVSAAR